MFRTFISLMAVSALAAALPADPKITAAPSEKELRARQDTLTCSIFQTTETNINQWSSPTATVTQAVCTCDGDLWPQVSTSLSTNSLNQVTTLQICNDYTTVAPTPLTSLSTSAQPTVSGAAVTFGDINPSNYIFEEIGIACLTGCPLSGSTTGTYVPTPASGGSTIIATPTELTLSWSITQAALPTESASNYFNAFTNMMGAGQSNMTFSYEEQTEDDGSGTIITGDPTQITQYSGPSVLGLQRFHNPDNSWGALDSVTIFFSSVLAESSMECDPLEKDLFTVLGLIPEVGSFLGAINTVACNGLSG